MTTMWRPTMALAALLHLRAAMRVGVVIRRRAVRLALSLVLLAQIGIPASAQVALPRGGLVVAGRASIGAPAGNGLTITQASPRAVIDWKDFSVGAPNSVTFNQPNSSAAILNRVTSTTPSSIAGQIHGNGQVMLVNPNGIVITPTGTVQAGGGFVGSTLDIKNSDFQAGKLDFTATGAPATVGNAGAISAGTGGFVALIGGKVSNSGTIRVPLGKVGLGSAQRATIDPTGDGFLQIAIPSGATSADGRPLIEIAGTIDARGGTVEISAATARQAMHDAVHISGTIAAQSVSGHRGSISLDGGAGGGVTVAGTLATDGGSLSPGGTIVATGGSVGLAPTARLDASGTMGGTILVGGDRKGGSVASAKLVAAPVRTARHTNVAPGAAIVANGTKGAGGNVVVWSDAQTLFQGVIAATGAGVAPGGTAEVSSHGWLGYRGSVDLGSVHGVGGTLTLDPSDLTVTTSASTISPAGGTYTSGSSSNVLNTDIQALLNAGTSVVLQTGTGTGGSGLGNITVSAPIAKTAGGAASLTLNASGSIVVNAAVGSTSGAMAVTLDSNRAGNGGFVTVAAAIATNGGDLIIGGGATPSTGFAVGTAAGSTTYLGGNSGVYVTAPLSAGGGAVTIKGTGASASGNYNIGIVQTAAISTTGTGGITLNGTGGGGSAAQGILSRANITAGTGNIALTGVANGYSSVGLNLTTATIGTTGAGTITLNGSTNTATGGVLNPAVAIYGGEQITAVNGLISVTGHNLVPDAGGMGVEIGGVTSSGTGGVTVVGTSGNTTGNTSGNYGVYLNIANAVQSTGTGPISITGTGGGGANSTGSNFGVYVGAPLSITGTASLTIVGTGGAGGSGASNHGVNVAAAIAGAGGAIAITGTGGASSGSGNLGIKVAAAVTNTGAGAITLNGTGGGTGTGEVGVSATANITAATGAVSITGMPGPASGTTLGINLASVAAGSGTIVLTTTGTATASGALTGAGLDLLGAGGIYTLNVANNAVATLAGATGSVTYLNNASFAIGSVAATVGLTTTGDTTLRSTGTVTQSQAIGAAGLELLGTGGVYTLNSVTNPVATLAGNTGTVKFLDNAGFAIGTVNTVGLTTTGNTKLRSTGTVTQSQAIGAAGLELLGTGGVYTLNSVTNVVTTLAGNTGTVKFLDNAGFAIGTVNTVGLATTGNTTLRSTGTVTQSQAIGAAGLDLLGTGGVYTLTNAGNAVTTLAGATGSATYAQTGALRIGTVGATVGLATTGVPWVTTGGALTIAAGATVSGAAPVLAAAGAFIDSGGAGAVVANSGRWLVYSAAPAADTFGSLDSGNSAVWNTAPNGTVAVGGNRYVFAYQPTLTFTSVGLGKVYGVDDTTAVAASYTVSGLQGAVAHAYLADTAAQVYSGAAGVTSGGAVATAGVSPYAITAATGTLVSNDGYALAYASTGVLTVTPASLTVTANNQSKVYGASFTFAGTEFTSVGLQNGETIGGVGLTSAGSVATANVAGSPYGIAASAATGGSFAAGNYSIGYVAGAMAVTPASLTVTASNQSKVYGTPFTFAGTEFTAVGLQNGETIGGVGLTSLGSVATASVAGGPYAITPSATTGGSFAAGNYSIGYVAGAMVVTPAALTVTANAQSRAYGAANPALTYAVGGAGLLNGDTLSGLLATAATVTSSVAVSPYAITQGTLAASANYALTYTGATLAITPAALTVTAGNQTKIYGGSLTFAGTEFTAVGLQNGETIGGVGLTSLGSVATANVAGGPYAIAAGAATGGSFAAGNYSIAYAPGAMTVTRAPLTVTARNQGKVYDSTTAAAATPIVTGTFYNGDVGNLAETYAFADAGTGLTLTPTATIAHASNYAVSYVATTGGAIVAAPLVITAATNTKVSDGTIAAAATPTVTGTFYNGDVGHLAESYAFADAGTGLTLTPSATIAHAANYAVSYVATATGAIVAAPIVVVPPSAIWPSSVGCPTIATACRKPACRTPQTSARGIAVGGGPCSPSHRRGERMALNKTD